MTKLCAAPHNSIGLEIEAEAQRRIARIMEEVAAEKTTIEAEIKKRRGAS